MPANPFADVDELPAFELKPKPANSPWRAGIYWIAEANNFPSRQAPALPPSPRGVRRWRTGQNQQLDALEKAPARDVG